MFSSNDSKCSRRAFRLPATSIGRANNTSSPPRVLLLAAPQQLLDAEPQMFRNQSPSAPESDEKDRRRLIFMAETGLVKGYSGRVRKALHACPTE